MALSYRIVFDAPMKHLLPLLYRDLAQEVHMRAGALAERLKESAGGLHIAHRIEHLQKMIGHIRLFELDL